MVARVGHHLQRVVSHGSQVAMPQPFSRRLGDRESVAYVSSLSVVRLRSVAPAIGSLSRHDRVHVDDALSHFAATQQRCFRFPIISTTVRLRALASLGGIIPLRVGSSTNALHLRYAATALRSSFRTA